MAQKTLTDVKLNVKFTEASTLANISSGDNGENIATAFGKIAGWYTKLNSNGMFTYTVAKNVPSDAVFTDHTYSVMGGASASAAGTAGLVPAPAAGKNTSFLRGDGTWVVPTDTTYTHPTYTAVTGQPTANQTPAFGGSFTVSQITTNTLGHVTGATSRTITIPATVASTSANGLMTKDQVTKLSGIATGATKVEASTNGKIKINGTDTTVYTHPSANHIPSGGAAGQFLTYDSAGTAKWSDLPSYVDDVIEGYYDATAKKFYEEAAHTTEIVGETGKIYVDLATDNTYRWSGGDSGAWVCITNPLKADRGLSLSSAGSVGHSNSITARTTAGAVKITYDAYGHITGTAALSKSDISLGNVENKSSATIRGEITSANVTTALGFTPANAATMATTSTAGLMTTAQVTKLSGIASGAEVNQNAFSNIKVGSTTVAADTKTDTITFTAGDYVTLTGDATNDAVTFAVNKMTGAVAASGDVAAKAGTGGAVPAPAAGDHNKFLRGDGTWVVPTNTDTHYTTGLKVGASATATANAAATNGNVYLNVLDNTTVRDSHKIVGSGATTVTSDANGVITISSTNSTYSAMTGATASAAGKAGLVPAPAAGKNTSFLRGDGTWVVPTNTNTTYTFAEGTTNGAFTVTPSGGTATSVKIHGLGSAAYTDYSAYATASHTHAAMTGCTADAAGKAGFVPAPATTNVGMVLTSAGTWGDYIAPTDTLIITCVE